ncbi:MAG: argininosuccinate lyase [Phycisphaerales bacterium]
MATLWGGRFEGSRAELFRAINDSLPFDVELLEQDVRGSIAWVGALARAGVLTGDEREALVSGLRSVLEEGLADRGAIVASGEEDIHSWVEARLTALVGDVGKKLHTGRSRNDQVATDLRLWTRDALRARIDELVAAQNALLTIAEREADTAFPAYTHLQRAQPVTFGHWCMAHVEALARDADRLHAARERANECPLGAAALAGTAYPIDRDALALDLGFARPTNNSLDAVSDRDFVVDALAAASLCAVHLSRFAEDLIVYTSAEFGYVELSDAVTSGSSLMPQKKNPDALELLRGKCGRIVGAHTAMLTTLKGLPLAYNKDLQEDKEPLFDAMLHLSICLRLVPEIVNGLDVRRDRAERASIAGYANATELADYLVRKGVPFRDAHHAVGRLVRLAIERGVELQDLSLDDMRADAPSVESDVYESLTASAAVSRRDVIGGAAPNRVRQSISNARARLRQWEVNE